MRDLGTLVWVVLVVVGVIGSMISSIRKQQAQQRPAGYRPQARPMPQPEQPGRPPRAAQPPSAPRVAAPPHALPEPQARGKLRLFANRGELVRGIIAAEVLGKPRALSDEHFPR